MLLPLAGKGERGNTSEASNLGMGRRALKELKVPLFPGFCLNICDPFPHSLFQGR